MHKQRRLPSVVLRPGLVIGHGSPPQHLGVGDWPSEILCIRWGRDVSRELPFVLVDDVASAFLSAIKCEINEVAGKKFNVVGDVRLSADEYVDALRRESHRDFRVQRQSVPAWTTIEFMKWMVKLLARKPENTRLTWREVAYRTAAARFDCEQTKRVLRWQPTSDREEFIERGIRAALRGQSMP
jgi:nucleoside-diphosphate-sugar epimerase